MKNKKHNILILLFIICMAIIGLWISPMKNVSLAVEEKNSVENETALKRKVPVVLSKVKRVNFEERLVVQGNVEAKNRAMVSPRIPGTIEKIFVNEGDQVIEGKTKLFQTDSVKLQKVLDIQKQGSKVSHYELLEENEEAKKKNFNSLFNC